MFGVLHSLQLINGMLKMEKLSQIMICLPSLNRRGGMEICEEIRAGFP